MDFWWTFPRTFVHFHRTLVELLLTCCDKNNCQGFHKNPPKVLRTHYTDTSYPKHSSKFAASPWVEVRCYGEKAAEEAMEAYENQHGLWKYDMGKCNCEHFARFICQGVVMPKFSFVKLAFSKLMTDGLAKCMW